MVLKHTQEREHVHLSKWQVRWLYGQATALLVLSWVIGLSAHLTYYVSSRIIRLFTRPLSLLPQSWRAPRFKPIAVDENAPAGSADNPYKVVVIGTGFSGLGMAHRLRKIGITNFQVFERRSEVGGTWYDNRCNAHAFLR
jgi:NAD(P)-binding Rossmann-like domain